MPIIHNKDLFEPLDALLKDAERAEKDLDSNDDDYARRNFVRTIFAMIEGTIYILKQTILAAASDGSIRLSADDEAMLREESYDLRPNGNLRTNRKFPKLPNNLQFTQRQLEKHLGLSINLGSKSDWDDFMTAVQIRHAITHPKTLQNFNVSDDNIILARRVAHWFGQFIIDWVKQFAPMLKPVEVIDADKTTDYEA